jgi:tripartite-type tricarboxylate transporter receptor subunit TctC
VIVENRPGGDEMIGDEMVAKATPDGYTLRAVSNTAITAAPPLHRDVRYDPVKDFTPIDMLGQITPVMVVPAKSPVHTVQELIALAKSEPGQLNFGSFGTGSYAHVTMEDFMQRTGIKMRHVPYRGATPAYEALIRGDVAVMIANLASAHAREHRRDSSGSSLLPDRTAPRRARVYRRSPSPQCPDFPPALGGGCSDRPRCRPRSSTRS